MYLLKKKKKKILKGYYIVADFAVKYTLFLLLLRVRIRLCCYGQRPIICNCTYIIVLLVMALYDAIDLLRKRS